MKKIGLLLGIGLLCVSLSSLAGEVITNGTGGDATGLRVTFSEPVQITAFGDTLMEVDQTGPADEFVFSGGTVSPWGSHWLNWTPSSATIVSHEWLRGSLTSKTHTGPPLVLPKTTTTCFPLLSENTDATGLPALEFSITLLSKYEADDTLEFQAIDGFSPGSTVPLERWCSQSVDDGIHTYSNLTPPPGSPVQYVYPDDGNTGYVALQYREPVDLSSFEGLRVVASADHPLEIEIVVGTCADEIPMDEDSPCGEGAARFSMLLSVTTEPQVFVLPFNQFEVHPYILQQHPAASTEPQFHGVFDMVFDMVFQPQDESGALWIHQVSAVRQEVVVEPIAPVINEYYFQHPAYVMQGVNGLDVIYALPLGGIPELGTGYAAIDPDSEELIWAVETSHPGIGAGFQNEILYIWGADADWYGYGEVMLSVEDKDGETDSISIPITVFRADKTLINAEGKKDYCVPWSPKLDINRILSVEEHMRTYNKDEGDLDRSIQWSRWKQMEPRHDVELDAMWLNSQISWNPWPLSSQLALVDVYLSELAEIGINSVNFWNEYYVSDETSPDIHAVFNTRIFGGGPPTKTAEEENYIANEAHRLGLSVTLGVVVSIGNPATNMWREICYASPNPLVSFYANYTSILSENLSRWRQLGVDMVDLCPALSSLNGYQNTYEEASLINDEIQSLASWSREIYKGPLYHGAHFPAEFFPGLSILYAPFWHSFDVIALSGWWGIELSPDSDPSLSQLVDGWRCLIASIFQPFQERFNKPFCMWENGCFAATGCARYGLICIRKEVFDESQPDIAEMSRYYIAHDLAFQEMEGYFAPGWNRYPLVPFRQGGIRDANNSMFRLKIEDTIQRICLGTEYSPVVVIDGELSDWTSSDSRIWEDPTDDSRGRFNLELLHFLQDDNHLYFRVDYTTPPTGDLRLEFDSDADGVYDFYAGLSNLYTYDGTWWGNSHLYLPNKTWIGIVDSIDFASSIELRINKRFLRDLGTEDLLLIRLVHYDTRSNWHLDDDTDWILLWGE